MRQILFLRTAKSAFHTAQTGVRPKNAHPAPEFGQTPGLPMGRRLFIPNPLAALSITDRQW